MYCMVNKAKRSKTNYIEADSALYEKSDEFPHILVTEATTSSINNSSSTTGSLATRTGSGTVKDLQEQVQTQQEQLVWQQDQSPETIL